MLVFRYLKESIKDDVYVDITGEPIPFSIVERIIRVSIRHLAQQFPSSIGVVLRRKPVVYTYDVLAMATDGIDIFVNPKFVAELFGGYYEGFDRDNVIDVVMYILAHEALHVIFRHPYEEKMEASKYPDHNRANVSQDAQINLYIEHVLAKVFADFIGIGNKMGMVYDTQFLKKGWKDIYTELPDDYKFLKQAEKIKHSKEWENGFLDGYARAMEIMRNENLIESCVL